MKILKESTEYFSEVIHGRFLKRMPQVTSEETPKWISEELSGHENSTGVKKTWKISEEIHGRFAKGNFWRDFLKSSMEQFREEFMEDCLM